MTSIGPASEKLDGFVGLKKVGDGDAVREIGLVREPDPVGVSGVVLGGVVLGGVVPLDAVVLL
ncbi:MAG: hypothetical protein ACR2JN_06285 [Lapillicoccus sp.]